MLVLEKHSERGGQTHVFRRDGASWDVGLHYIGNLQPGTFERSLFDFLSAGALEWNRMTDEFERLVYPDLRSPFPPIRSATNNGSSSDTPTRPRPSAAISVTSARLPAGISSASSGR